jgi:hypothetical protein
MDMWWNDCLVIQIELHSQTNDYVVIQIVMCCANWLLQVLTGDLKGKATNSQFTQAVIDNLQWPTPMTMLDDLDET